ncbi:MAG: hypothetical protein JNJ92_04885 [Altererythrobacter sp.]|nr:hypothetical protein [Altererythrobacter sp.]
MSDQTPNAANDSEAVSGVPSDRLDALTLLHGAIASVLAEADRLRVPMVSIHLDHAGAICLAEIAKHRGVV